VVVLNNSSQFTRQPLLYGQSLRGEHCERSNESNLPFVQWLKLICSRSSLITEEVLS